MAMGWVWAAEEQELQVQAERAQLEAQKADEEKAAQLQKETEKIVEQVRRNEQERAEKLKAMSAEDRAKHNATLRDRLMDLEKMRAELRQKLGEDHPQIEAVAREMDVLKDELQELAAKGPTPQEIALEQELDNVRLQLRTHLKYRDKLAAALRQDHPTLLKAQDKVSELEKLLQDRVALLEQFPKQQFEREGTARKIEHLRAAAEHLVQAGMLELAQEVRRRAEDLQRELQPQSVAPTDAVKQLQEQMRDMQAALAKLYEEIAALREQLKDKKE
jgi:hypothetical protein